LTDLCLMRVNGALLGHAGAPPAGTQRYGNGDVPNERLSNARDAFQKLILGHIAPRSLERYRTASWAGAFQRFAARATTGREVSPP
jgi:hypothetical protein